MRQLAATARGQDPRVAVTRKQHGADGKPALLGVVVWFVEYMNWAGEGSEAHEMLWGAYAATDVCVHA